MEFLGVGPAELLLILVIALIVVGPERLPEIARTIAKTLNNLRAMSQSLTAEWQQEMKAVNDIKAGAQELQQSLTEPLKAAQADLQQTLTEPFKEAQAAQTDIRRAFSQPLAAPSSTAADAPPAAPTPQPSPTESPSDGADKPASDGLFEQPLTPPLMLPLDPPPASDDSAAQPQPAEISDTSNNHSDQAND
jgi:sec-independent protein translocase protein TatB